MRSLSHRAIPVGLNSAGLSLKMLMQSVTCWLAVSTVTLTRYHGCTGFEFTAYQVRPASVPRRGRRSPNGRSSVLCSKTDRRGTPFTGSSRLTPLNMVGSPDPRAYYPDGEGEESTAEVSGDDEFPEIGPSWKLGGEPKGIGTLFEKEGEIIRELSSDEYVDIVRDWAPVASFASKEVSDQDMRKEATCILNALRGMAEWQPERRGDYTQEGSRWSFGAPVGAIKGGQVDAVACLQVSEEGGIVIEWVCGNPISVGIPGNAVDWLTKGIETLCGRRLELPVSTSARATGKGSDDDSDDKSGDARSGGRNGSTKRGSSKRNGGSKKNK